MLGVQLLGNSKLKVKEYPDPKITSSNEVLVKIKASAICGSEMHAFRSPNEQKFNVGHEATGIVVDTGGSTELAAGDRVGIHTVLGCGKCQWCEEGKYTYCDNLVHQGGMHAEFKVVPERVCLKLPDDVPFDVGVLLTGDGLGVPYRASQRLNTKKREYVCVIGVGPIGLGNTMMQSFLGAKVIAIDLNDYRLSLAKELGAEYTINSQSVDPVEAVKKITKGMLADKCIEAAGQPKAVRLALKLAGKAATVMVLAGAISSGADLIGRDMTLMVSLYYHYAEYPEMLEVYRKGLPVAKMISDHFPLTEAQKAFTKFAEGKAGKVILEYTPRLRNR